MRLLVFSGSQAPLAVRYPHPTPNPPLTLPPLVHRALHTALDPATPSVALDADTLVVPQPAALAKHPLPAADGDTLEATLKLHITRARTPDAVLAAVPAALAAAADFKGLKSVDTLLIGLPDDVDDDTWAQTWGLLTAAGALPAVKTWGTLGLRQTTLARLAETRAPAVNELDVRDCETLPREYLAFAAGRGIQLWASGGGAGSDPLPSADLHNLLQEFAPKLALVAPEAGAAVASLIRPAADGTGYDPSAAPGVRVEWVLNYTLLSRARNIVRDKGYVVAANFEEQH